MKDDCGRAGSAHVTDDSIQAAADLVTLQVAACTRIGRFYGEERLKRVVAIDLFNIIQFRNL